LFRRLHGRVENSIADITTSTAMLPVVIRLLSGPGSKYERHDSTVEFAGSWGKLGRRVTEKKWGKAVDVQERLRKSASGWLWAGRAKDEHDSYVPARREGGAGLSGVLHMVESFAGRSESRFCM
jgi:hypothetical protein